MPKAIQQNLEQVLLDGFASRAKAVRTSLEKLQNDYSTVYGETSPDLLTSISRLNKLMAQFQGQLAALNNPNPEG